jgi:L-lactate dehydrogenase complex protein LldF
MTSKHEKFLADSEKAFDENHRKIINHNTGVYEKALSQGLGQFSDLALARKRAATCKHRVLENLEEYLKEFEHNFIGNGGKVIWAQDAVEAQKAILDIAEKNFVRKVVKSKSMVTEEIGLREFLEKNGIEAIETDLGEYIVQLNNDKPYHIVTPAMHLSAAAVSQIFSEKHGLPENSTPHEITAFVRELLREKFINADMGITGANFLVSSTGSVAITENEGNGVLSASLPPIHVVIAGIEKIIPSVDDLNYFWPLLSSHGTGQHLSCYNSLVGGRRKHGEYDGPQQMYVILLDNGRTNLLAQIPQRRALSCIKCGACLNVCPVFKNIGGHAYGTVYQGPIGAVINPHINDFKEHVHLSFASSLCGKCTEVCPVNIDLHHQLLKNRQLNVDLKFCEKNEKRAIKAFKWFMSKRSRLDKINPKWKNFGVKYFFKKSWGNRRELPIVAPKSFAQLWDEKNKGPE